ncbi:MAG: AbiJ-NTD4 domain-containing protein [Thermodesulfovibrionales bacterium]
MQDDYFSERELGLTPRNVEKVDKIFWDGLTALIQSRINDGSFAERFPLNCSDSPIPIGSDESSIKSAFQSEFPSMQWPLHLNDMPDTLSVLDAVEFFYRCISKPIRKEYHSFFKHHHILSFDQDAGRQEYLHDVNRLLRRNNLVYELLADGRVVRLEPVILRETLASAIFRTEERELNRLLELAREKFCDPDINVRREAVEKLWDAWERLKTLEPGSDKKKQIEALLTKAIPQSEFRERVNQEAIALTSIGNDFAIRHTEINKIIIAESEYLDYLFHRLFALIQLLLRRIGCGG